MRAHVLFFVPFVVACGGTTVNASDAGDASTKDSPISDVLIVEEIAADVTPPTNPYDGVTGKACTTDGDCATQNGPNLARCSNSVLTTGEFFPDAVCVLPSCSPVSDDSSIHFCDGPDVPSSPGICAKNGNGTICLPKCTYDKSGNPPSGCIGKDACNAYSITAAAGIGYCFGGCTQDADCKDGQKCQTDRGWCLPGVTPPTKPLGASCTSADNNALTCDCFYGSTNSGYCSQFCTVGGSQCPPGYTCDSLELRLSGYTTPNTGMAGYCTLTCASDAGVCPSPSVCTAAFVAGPDCIP